MGKETLHVSALSNYIEWDTINFSLLSLLEMLKLGQKSIRMKFDLYKECNNIKNLNESGLRCRKELDWDIKIEKEALPISHDPLDTMPLIMCVNLFM